MKVEFYVGMTCMAIAKKTEIVEIEDDATDEQIQQYYEDWLSNEVEYGWIKQEQQP